MAERNWDEGPGVARSVRRAERWVIGSAVLSVLVFAGVAITAGGPGVWRSIAGLDVMAICVLLSLSLVNYGMRVLRWLVFSQRLDIRVPAGPAGLYYVAGFAMTVTPGKLGEALRLWLLNRGHGYRYERTTVLLVADRLSDAGAMALMCLAGLSAFTGYAWTALVGGGAILAATGLFLRPALLLALVEWLFGKLGRWPRLFARIRLALRHSGRLASFPVYGGTLALAVVGWLAEAVALWWLLDALGAPISLAQAVFVFAFAMIAGAAAMLPGGLGGTEVGMVGLLIAIGIDLDVAIAATAIIRATTLWFAVGLGFLALPFALRMVGRPAGIVTGRA
ncbi:lysylphosphatidylglycerol synthase transmembrane domain-containing protein [Marinivivus vitaminiproducens]|uniref:lysylphosphatidylglycerol synthase transmembrane domain-containing protein n=1 Tax=Marinivivus vitaminiproducens TaxID=3035935 RepID=UPI00279C18BF|nr:lysylphosphatidylglycerol synthase transmembrane domain-containing protein [Geminicoccaceae bacterium SCSIO 64248]